MPSSTGGLATEVLGYSKQPTVLIGGGTSGAFTLPDKQGLMAGTMLRTISSAGLQPGATAADNVIAVFSIPAGLFDGSGNRGIRIRAWGKYGATANNKTVKIIFNPTTAVVGATVSGGTTVVTTGVVASNNLPFDLGASIYKYGDIDSNTQIAFQDVSVSGAALVVPTIPVLTTAVENAAILLAVTGNAATVVTDILLHGIEVTGYN